MNCVNQAKVVFSSMVLSCFCLLPAGAQVYNFDTSSFEPTSITGANTPATVAPLPAIPAAATSTTYSMEVVPAPIPVMPWDNPNVPPDMHGTFGNSSNTTALNATQSGQTLSNVNTYTANPLAGQTANQRINLPQATQGLLAPGSAGGMNSFASGQYNFGFPGGAGAYINAGVNSFRYGSILPPCSTGSVDFDITQ
jgi:hypothetical protein